MSADGNVNVSLTESCGGSGNKKILNFYGNTAITGSNMLEFLQVWALLKVAIKLFL